MAYVPGFKNDIFVSYAHVDNESSPDGEPWVSRLVNDAVLSLRRRLGNTDDLRVFFDARVLAGHEHLDALTQNARNSALFIAVVSPSYVARTWTRAELAAFAGAASTAGRIFALDTLPLERDAYPSELRDLIRRKFWDRAPDSEVPFTIDPQRSREKYTARVEDLAHGLRQRLLDLRGTPQPSRQAGARSSGYDDPRPSVLLAQVSDDLEEEREQVRRHLEQFDIRVLPEATYPQGGGEFAAAFEADCSRAKCFVQLLGPFAARRPPDLPEGYTRLQYDVAKRHKLAMALWRRPDLAVDSVVHRDAELLSSPEVIAVGLEAFKAEVERMVRRPTTPPPGTSAGAGGFVFIDADRSDLGLAQQLYDAFKVKHCGAALPALEGPSEDIRRDLEDNIIECSALVLVYGAAQPTWVRGQLRLYSKLKPRREKPPRVLAIYCGPPEEKPDLGIVLPEARWIDARRSTAQLPVDDLVVELLS